MPADKRQLLKAIRQVFTERGYDGATLVHLARATGLSKASLYHHFPGGKPEMAAVLVRQAITDLQQLAFSPLAAADDPLTGLRRVLEGYLIYTDRGHSTCFLAVLSHHGTAHQEIGALQSQITGQVADWHRTLRTSFEARGAKPKRAARRAHDFLAAIYGALMNAKLHNDPLLFETSMRRLSRRLED